MSESQTEILNEVRDYLVSRGEECEWITSATNPAEKTGIAYVQFESTLPCSFLFTWDKIDSMLALDVLFASPVPSDRHVEMALILSRLNYTLNKGRFVIDLEGGYIIYRQSTALINLGLTHEQKKVLFENMERQALKMAETYADLIERDFRGYC